MSSAPDAGELQLVNNDVLSGELIAVERDHVLWNSTAIGQLVVPKTAIISLYTALPLKLYGIDEACHWLKMDTRDVLIECGKDSLVRRSLASLENVVLYQTYFVSGYQFDGQLLGAGTYSSGNRQQNNYLLDIDMVVRHHEYRHLSGLTYESETGDSRQFIEEFEATYGLNWFFARRTFLFGDSSAARDESRGIERRYTAGSGLGYQFWDTSKSALALQSGLEYRYERLEDNQLPRDEATLWRLSANARHLLPRDIQFYAMVDYFQSINEKQDWLVDAEAGLTLPIALGISANLKYEFDYDSTPVEGLRKADASLRLGFGYQW